MCVRARAPALLVRTSARLAGRFKASPRPLSGLPASRIGCAAPGICQLLHPFTITSHGPTSRSDRNTCGRFCGMAES